MKNSKTIFILACATIVMLGIYSCKCDSCNRLDWQFDIEFRGYSDSEVIPLILKSYPKGSGFTNLRDSVVLPDVLQLIYDGGTGMIVTLYGNDSTDYIISPNPSNPALPDIEITEMNFVMQECRTCSKKYHIHALKSYRWFGNLADDLNGSRISFSK